MAIKRIVTKTGQVQYRDKGKIVSPDKGRPAWVKSNKAAISDGKISYDNLSKKEKLSYTAQNRVRYKGKVINASQEKAIRLKLQEENNIRLPKGAELSRALKGVTPEKYLDGIEDTYWYNKDQQPNVSFGLQNDFTLAMNRGNEITATVGGVKYYGLEAIEKINEFYVDFYSEHEGYKTAIPLFKVGQKFAQIGDVFIETLSVNLDDTDTISSP